MKSLMLFLTLYPCSKHDFWTVNTVLNVLYYAKFTSPVFSNSNKCLCPVSELFAGGYKQRDNYAVFFYFY